MMTGFERYTKKTRRERFLEDTEQIVPWEKSCALIESHYPTPGNGRRPKELEQMHAERVRCFVQPARYLTAILDKSPFASLIAFQDTTGASPSRSLRASAVPPTRWMHHQGIWSYSPILASAPTSRHTINELALWRKALATPFYGSEDPSDPLPYVQCPASRHASLEWRLHPPRSLSAAEARALPRCH